MLLAAHFFVLTPLWLFKFLTFTQRVFYAIEDAILGI